MVHRYNWSVYSAVFMVLVLSSNLSAQINFTYGSSYKYLKGSEAVSLNQDWINSNFNDSDWNTGNAPFHYGDGIGGTELLDMQGNYSTIFLRTKFTARQISKIQTLRVSADWDDGFILFINGTEAIRRQAPEFITFDALSSGLHESGDIENINISANKFNLQEGENTLAIFACNTTLAESSDFFIDVNITAALTQPDAPEFIDSVGVAFSKKSGFYYTNFSLALVSPITDANIVYTLDGSNPQTSSTSIKSGSSAQITINPNSKENRGTTPAVVVRASIVKDGFKPSKPSARTFIFLDNVKKQSYPGWDWPSYNVNDQVIDYDMDQDVSINGTYASQIEDAMLDIPTMSVITDNANLFDASTGIYVNAMSDGSEWERECSIELINPNGVEGFNVNAGLRIRGGWSRHPEYPKHAFRLFFREEYGERKLHYPLFGDEGVDHFDKVDLRCAQNYSWSNWEGEHNTFAREVFLRDAQGETGKPYTRSRYYHLFLNGMYWGLFQTQERSEARFASDYLGGKTEDWDVLKKGDYGVMATDGDTKKWRQVWDLAESGFSNNKNYFKLEGKDEFGNPMKNSEILVDIDNLIDYMINIFYSGNFDSPVSSFGGNTNPNNLYMIKNREDKTQGFQFLIHDAEHAMMMVGTSGPGTIGLHENRVDLAYRDANSGLRMNNPGFGSFHPQWLHHRLTLNKEYRARFADLAEKRLTKDGIFTKNANIERLNKRAEMIDMAIIGESARWGDSKKNPAYSKADWEKEINILRNNYFPKRTEIVIDQLRDYNLFPSVLSPVVKLNGTVLDEELIHITGASSISFESAAQEIYYSIDGTDPRALDGDFSPTAIKIGSGTSISISSSAIIKVRAVTNADWSSCRTIKLIAEQNDYSKFKVTELHYHPLDSIVGTDTIEASNYEFIEFKNTSTTEAINLSGVKIDSAINFEFDENTLLAPQQYFVVAAKPKKYYDRYGMLPQGNFSNSFSNGGERVIVVGKTGEIFIDFTYFDEKPWPADADGNGLSLVAVQENPNGDPADYFYWTASGKIHGSPNYQDIMTDIDEEQVASNFINTVRVYPNPTTDVFNISFGAQNHSDFTVKLYDLKGTMIFNGQYAAKASVSLMELNIEYGVYMVSIESDNQIQTKKLIYTPY